MTFANIDAIFLQDTFGDEVLIQRALELLLHLWIFIASDVKVRSRGLSIGLRQKYTKKQDFGL